MDAWNAVPPETARRLLETQYQQSLVEVTERMFAAAGIGHGQRVLDIGTGGGDIALAAADRVGPTGWVLATDASMDALRGLAAQLRARPQPLPNMAVSLMAESTHMLGLVAGVLTTVAFVPQVLKTWRSKSAGDISLGMFVVFSAGLALWLVYGLLIDAWPIVIANTTTLALSLALLYLKLRYGARPR